MGQPTRGKGPVEVPRVPRGGWIGSVLRLPQGLDLRRSASRRRSAPVGSGRFVRQTAPTERISSTLHAGRTPRRSGPSYSRRWPRRSGAFQYSHRREPVRQTIASLSGTASTPIGIPYSIVRILIPSSSDELSASTKRVRTTSAARPAFCPPDTPAQPTFWKPFILSERQHDRRLGIEQAEEFCRSEWWIAQPARRVTRSNDVRYCLQPRCRNLVV